MKNAIEIRHYLTRSGKDVFDSWISSLRDVRTQAKILSRLDRLAAGNFGDCKPLSEGLWEVRIDWGPGFRIYYSMQGKDCVVLFAGGEKHRQTADIARALAFLADYKRRTKSDEV